jgi:diguanylate cyclase (GGDEF)-like protein
MTDVDPTLRSAIEATAPLVGGDFVHAVVRQIGTAVAAQTVVVAVSPQDGVAPSRRTAIATWTSPSAAASDDDARRRCEYPLAISGEPVGTLTITTSNPEALRGADERLLRALIDRTAAEVARIRADESAYERSRRDPLTGALNHGAINEMLERLLADGETSRCALAMVDVDGMKATNDTYGHQVGDALLVAVTNALSQSHAVVGRYGGDEFIAVLPGAGRDAAEDYRDDVMATLSDTIVREHDTGVRVPVGISIGLAIYPDEATGPEDLIRLADNAMYASRRDESKTAGVATRRLGSERVASIVGEIVPLLTAPGGREEKLGLVAQQLSVGAGYDAVNFEVAGPSGEEAPAWERAYVRAPSDIIEAWMQEQQGGSSEHPLTMELERTRRPIFIDDVPSSPHLLPAERDLITAAGLKSGLVVPMVWQNRIVGMLSVASKREAAFTAWDARFLTTVAAQVTAIVFMTTIVDELQATSADLMRAQLDTVMMLAAAAEAHDHTTGRHIQRVRALAEALALELGYTDAQANAIGIAGVLHDIGKIRVPDAVLTSPGKLSDDEWVIMKQHTLWGGEFLDGRIGFELAAVVARAHHERWDGGGYPLGLKGDEIPEAAAITSVADSFDAMTNDRPYRAGMPVADAVEELLAHRGTQFSPRVVDALVRLHEKNAIPFAPQPRDEHLRAA